MSEPLKSIRDVEVQCPWLGCQWRGTVAEAIPDYDGDGNLGCPRCSSRVEQIKSEKST